MKVARHFAVLAGSVLLLATPSLSRAQTWTTWTSSSPGHFFGTLLSAGVDFIGAYAGGSQFSCCGTDFFAPTDPYTQSGLTAPDAGGNVGFVQIIDPTVATLKFSAAVTNLYLAFISVGAPGTTVTYTFNHPFTVLSNNDCPTPAFFGCGSYSTAGMSLTGEEFSGTIQFSGTFDELTITTDPFEDWHGITVGAASAVPEPTTVSLMGVGLFALGGFARRRRTPRA